MSDPRWRYNAKISTDDIFVEGPYGVLMRLPCNISPKERKNLFRQRQEQFERDIERLIEKKTAGRPRNDDTPYERLAEGLCAQGLPEAKVVDLLADLIRDQRRVTMKRARETARTALPKN